MNCSTTHHLGCECREAAWKAKLEAAQAENEMQRSDLLKLREVLVYYANPQNYRIALPDARNPQSMDRFYRRANHEDSGRRARDVLNALPAYGQDIRNKVDRYERAMEVAIKVLENPEAISNGEKYVIKCLKEAIRGKDPA